MGEIKTKICCLDVDKKIIDFLSEGFDVYNGSLGKIIELPKSYYNTINVLLNLDIPNNIHEYDVIIDDMYKPEHIIYNNINNMHKNIINGNNPHFICHRPDTIFDPIPASCEYLYEMLRSKKDGVPIKIMFQNIMQKIEYKYEENGSSVNYHSYSNYDHITNFTKESISGEELQYCNNKLSGSLYNGLTSKLRYVQTYYDQQSYDKTTNQTIIDNRFVPLLKNNNGDVVSYYWHSDSAVEFMLPQTDVETKLIILKRLFNEVLYKEYSDYFPTITEKMWTKNEVYYLPNHKELVDIKEEIRKKCKEKEEQIDKEIKENDEKFSFLHKIITESGDELVAAMVDYLKWLGFIDVRTMDEVAKEGLLEEDIQVNLEDKGLLVIEVKGIGGTSTDAECSQISKIKYRRCEERNKFDVNALYIVNNERHVEPLKRTNPPFNKTQIKDATNDKRGLIYTWQLFNLFYNITNNLITKDEARKCFLQTGLVDFTPKMIKIGMPYDYYQKNKVICVEIKNITINREKGFIVYSKDGRYIKEKILSIEENKKPLEEIQDGKIGIELESPIIRNVEVYYVES